MNEEKIQQIKDSLREVIQLLVQRGKPLSPELKLQIARVMDHAAQRIQQLRQEGQAEQAPQLPVKAPEVPQAQYPSSNIFGYQYDPSSKDLFIKFMGKDNAESGPVYSYSGVPQYIFEVIKRGAVAPRTSGKNKYHAWHRGKTPSHGASVYALVKEAEFPYQRVA